MALFQTSHKCHGDFCGSCYSSIGLTDTEVDPPSPLLRLAVDKETVDWIQLVTDVEADGTDWRLIAKAGPDRVAQIAKGEAARQRPHITAIEEQHAAKFPPQ